MILGRRSAKGRPRLLVVGVVPFRMELPRAARGSAEVVAAGGSPSAQGLALADIPRMVDIRDVAAVVVTARLEPEPRPQS